MNATSLPHPMFGSLPRRGVLACVIAAALLLASGSWAKETPPPAAPAPAKPDSAAATASAAPADSVLKLPPEQLQSLVAPIALYPDDLLVQTLVASTYPLELVQLHQWLAKHPDLKDKALVDSVAAQPWDPSIQSMAALPDVVKRLSDDIQWTTDLGNAFLARGTDGRPIVHCHAVLSTAAGVFGGHVMPHLSITGVNPPSVLVTCWDGFDLKVRFDPETNIPLIQPSRENSDV